MSLQTPQSQSDGQGSLRAQLLLMACTALIVVAAFAAYGLERSSPQGPAPHASTVPQNDTSVAAHNLPSRVAPESDLQVVYLAATEAEAERLYALIAGVDAIRDAGGLPPLSMTVMVASASPLGGVIAPVPADTGDRRDTGTTPGIRAIDLRAP